jgi:ABC-2 type transport system permease protein
MRKLLVVAARDYLATVRTKGFLISLLVMPILMSGSIVAQRLLGDQVDLRERRFAVVDRSPGGKLARLLQEKSDQRNQAGPSDSLTGRPEPPFQIEIVPPEDDPPLQRFELSNRVRNKELYGFLEIGPHIYEVNPTSLKSSSAADHDKAGSYATAVRYQSNRSLDELFPNWARRCITEEVQRARTQKAHLQADTVQTVQEILAPIHLESKDLTRKNPQTGEIEEAPEESKALSFIAPFGLMMLMFMVIMVGATPLMQGVVEEKMQRIAEVLLGSVSPFQLMMGKLLGTIGVSLTLVSVYLGGAYYAAHRYGLAERLPTELLVWFLVYQVLAVVLYGSLFIAIGAACTDMKETQSLIWPVMLLATMPMFVCFNVIREPNSTFATWASYFPPATPMLMIVRQAVPPGIPPWQPALGAVIVLATTIFCVYAAGRIFRVGILMQGKGARIGEMLRWVVRG